DRERGRGRRSEPEAARDGGAPPGPVLARERPLGVDAGRTGGEHGSMVGLRRGWHIGSSPCIRPPCPLSANAVPAGRGDGGGAGGRGAYLACATRTCRIGISTGSGSPGWLRTIVKSM